MKCKPWVPLLGGMHILVRNCRQCLGYL